MKISIGIHGDGDCKGGLYNMLASFSLGLHKGLKTQTEPVKYVYEYLQAMSAPHIAIAFNVIGYNIWDELIKFGTKNIMWTVDSPFHQNISVYEKYKDSQGFASFAVSPSDIEAMKLFFPNIPYFYIPHGTDLDIWQPDDSGEEKEHDIVFLGSIRDYEQNFADLKEKLDKNIYKLLMNIYDFALQNPDKSFWDIYNLAADQYGFERNNLQLYVFLFQNVCYNITDARRVKLIESLNGLGVKVWGNAIWQKYIKGDAQYMGSAELFEAVKIVRKSKIVLHLQPMQIIDGFHERIFNTTASGSFLLASHQKNFEESFGDKIGYYSLNNIAGVAERAQYLLANNDEREEKAKAAREITLQNHTWASRAKEILKLIKVE